MTCAFYDDHVLITVGRHAYGAGAGSLLLQG